MSTTTENLHAANRRGATKKAVYSALHSVRFDARSKRLVFSLSSGLDLVFAPESVPELRAARPVDLVDYQISPSGLGVYFPKLDADLYLPSLLSNFMGSKNWLASEMGKSGGKQSSVAKANASKANGKLGGRPKKLQELQEMLIAGEQSGIADYNLQALIAELDKPSKV